MELFLARPTSTWKFKYILCPIYLKLEGSRKVIYLCAWNMSHGTKNEFPEARHAPVQCSEKRRIMSSADPGSASAGETALLHRTGLSAIHHSLSAIVKCALRNSGRYSRLTRCPFCRVLSSPFQSSYSLAPVTRGGDYSGTELDAEMGTTEFFIRFNSVSESFDSLYSWLTMALQELIQINSRLRMYFWNLFQIDSRLKKLTEYFDSNQLAAQKTFQNFDSNRLITQKVSGISIRINSWLNNSIQLLSWLTFWAFTQFRWPFLGFH